MSTFNMILAIAESRGQNRGPREATVKLFEEMGNGSSEAEDILLRRVFGGSKELFALALLAWRLDRFNSQISELGTLCSTVGAEK